MTAPLMLAIMLSVCIYQKVSYFKKVGLSPEKGEERKEGNRVVRCFKKDGRFTAYKKGGVKRQKGG